VKGLGGGGCGQVLLLLCSTTCGNVEDGCGISNYVHIYIFCFHGVNFYLNEGFNSMKSWTVSCGTVFFFVNQVRGFIKYTLRNLGGARVRFPDYVGRWSAGGERLTLWRCQDKAATRVGVACGGVIYKQYLWGDAGLCIA
jgi:hypothetical protein